MVRILETVESYRELCAGIQDLYMSNLGNRMNEIMKVLTLMASIFIPLSFFAGLYGMNFNTDISPWNMPELNTRFGYPLLLLFMLIVAGAMLAWFRWKDWF
jgi:magnesium transporter